MNELVKTGKLRTILISMCVLLVSLHSIYFYQTSRPEIDTSKLIPQTIRFLLTIGLLLAAYKGKKWAKNVSTVLFSIGVILALFGLVAIETSSFILQIPFIVMILVYSIAVFQFGFSKSYQAFYEYQNLN